MLAFTYNKSLHSKHSKHNQNTYCLNMSSRNPTKDVVQAKLPSIHRYIEDNPC